MGAKTFNVGFFTCTNGETNINPRLRSLQCPRTTSLEPSNDTSRWPLQRKSCCELPITLPNMKLSLLLTLLVSTYEIAMAAPSPEGQLLERDDCGAGGAPFTRRTNSPCGASNGGHLYCGCDKSGVISRHTCYSLVLRLNSTHRSNVLVDIEGR